MKTFCQVIMTIFCILTIPKIHAQTVYKDVAPIFYSRCTSCHHENQHAPSMMNYSETIALSYSMMSDLMTNKMPPWPPDTSYTRFEHEHIITTSEKNAIINWISNGGLAGDTTLAPPPPVYSPFQLNGTPDLVLRTGMFTSNAGSTDAYNCFSIPTNLTQDRILRAYEIVPGNVPIVHHVVVNLDSMGTTSSSLSGTCYTITGDIGIGGYAPGAPPTVFPGQAPLKAGIRIKAGSKLVLQIHYPAGTIGQIDSTQIRLYFYPIGTTGVRTIYNNVPLQNWGLNIPANTTRTFNASYTLPAAISIFSDFPHSHKVCTSLINYAYQANDTIPLIRINSWKFDWQGYYTFRNLVKVPSGYTLFASHFFDNTINNPNNPNSPPLNVYAGTSTTDEMLFDAIQCLLYQPGDETINIDSILANDPLLSANVNEHSFDLTQTYVYPNPSTDLFNIYLSKESEYRMSIFSIAGQRISETIVTDNFTSLSTKNVPDGMYLLKIEDTKSNEQFVKKIIISH
ncbi:MAG: T9SS type A sorting domain-containing protein [Bacteroidota bacterium]